MILFMIILIIIFCWFKPIGAELKHCSDTEDSISKICFSGNEKYVPPFPVSVHIDIHLREIFGIDIHKKSINTRLGLTTYWNDPRLALKNDSIE